MSIFNVPYLVGTTFGRDHQLWPTITKAQLYALGLGSDTTVGNWRLALSNPIGMTLDQIQIMSWKVHEWKVAASSWVAQSTVVDAPVVSQDDIAQINDTGSTPEFKFRSQRYRPDLLPGTFTPVDITNEKDILSHWLNGPLKGDFVPPAYTIPIWKTLRNLGVSQGFSNGIDADNIVNAADPTQITGSFNFTEPYNHAKFGEAGSFTGGVLIIFTMAGYIIYDPDTKLFYPPLFFEFGSTILPLTRAANTGVRFFLLPINPPPTPPPQEGFNEYVNCGFFTLSFGDSGVPSVQARIARYKENPIPGFTFPVVTGSFNLEMSPSKWRPFCNSLGEPIYNETTGAPTGNNPHA